MKSRMKRLGREEDIGKKGFKKGGDVVGGNGMKRGVPEGKMEVRGKKYI